MRRLIYLVVAFIFITGCTSLKTPEISGIVVDAETGQAIEGAYVVAHWGRTYSGPGGQFGGETSKELKLRTGNDGSFKVPSYTLINYVPYPFGQGGSFSIAFYAHGYEKLTFTFNDQEGITKYPKYEEFKRLAHIQRLDIKLESLKDEKKYLQNVKDMRAIDPAYTIDEYQLFLRKYPESHQAPMVLWEIGVIYRVNMKDVESAKKVFFEVLQKYPESNAARFSHSDLNEIEYEKGRGK